MSRTIAHRKPDLSLCRSTTATGVPNVALGVKYCRCNALPNQSRETVARFVRFGVFTYAAAADFSFADLDEDESSLYHVNVRTKAFTGFEACLGRCGNHKNSQNPMVSLNAERITVSCQCQNGHPLEMHMIMLNNCGEKIYGMIYQGVFFGDPLGAGLEIAYPGISFA